MPAVSTMASSFCIRPFDGQNWEENVGSITSNSMLPGHVASATLCLHITKDSFFFWMSILLLGFVLVGFAPTFYLRPAGDALPLHLVIHGVLLTAWFVWFVVELDASSAGNTRLHRQLSYSAPQSVLRVFLAARWRPQRLLNPCWPAISAGSRTRARSGPPSKASRCRRLRRRWCLKHRQHDRLCGAAAGRVAL